MISRAIDHDFGDEVSMEYVELADGASREKYQDIIQMARRKYMRFPLVMVNGEIAFHGSLDYYSLSAAIKRLLPQLRSGS